MDLPQVTVKLLLCYIVDKHLMEVYGWCEYKTFLSVVHCLSPVKFWGAPERIDASDKFNLLRRKHPCSQKMSTHSIISLPPQLEMSPKSISHLLSKRFRNSPNDSPPIAKREGDFAKQIEPGSGEADSSLKRSGKYVDNVDENPNVIKLSENSFPISANQPVNLRIMLHAASQMSSTRFRKVIYVKDIFLISVILRHYCTMHSVSYVDE